jgi:hypothetical protein
MAKIHESIAAIMADCPAISKSQKNQQQGFLYRGIDVVMNVLQPLMIKHKVFALPEVLESIREERATKTGSKLIYTILKVKYTFYADDGSCVSAVVQGEGMDSADKSGNKAMSVAFKYACFQVFCIPTEEMIDPDATTPEPSTRVIKCSCCGGAVVASGKMTAETIVDRSLQKFGKIMCYECSVAANKNGGN